MCADADSPGPVLSWPRLVCPWRLRGVLGDDGQGMVASREACTQQWPPVPSHSVLDSQGGLLGPWDWLSVLWLGPLGDCSDTGVREGPDAGVTGLLSPPGVVPGVGGLLVDTTRAPSGSWDLALCSTTRPYAARLRLSPWQWGGTAIDFPVGSWRPCPALPLRWRGGTLGAGAGVAPQLGPQPCATELSERPFPGGVVLWVSASEVSGRVRVSRPSVSR